jgi:hypothetical protein
VLHIRYIEHPQLAYAADILNNLPSMVVWTTPCPYSNMKKGPPMNYVEQFYIQSHHYNKKNYPRTKHGGT